MFVLLVLAVVVYTAFITLVSRAAGKLDDGLSGFIYNGVGALMPLLAYVVIKTWHSKSMLATSKSGIIFSVLAGVSIGLFTLVMMKIFQKGSLGYVMPVVYGGAILLSSVAGWVLFNANVNALQVSGLLLVVIGIVLVGVSKTA